MPVRLPIAAEVHETDVLDRAAVAIARVQPVSTVTDAQVANGDVLEISVSRPDESIGYLTAVFPNNEQITLQITLQMTTQMTTQRRR